jgi:4-hydroxy-tetrahydrodipicolinate synthase
MDLKGLIVALITPFDDGGRIDFPVLDRLVEELIERGADGFVPTGTTGESATLSHEEHLAVIERVVKISRERVPVIAGTGSNSTEEAIALTRGAKKAGAHAALLITPYYNRPTQEGLYQHFKAIHDAVDLPLILYNIPSRTAVQLEPETIGRLAELPRIVGIKDSTSSVSFLSHVMRRVPPSFVVLSGDDLFTLALLSLGGKGVISVAGHLVPEKMKAMIQAFEEGKFEEARRIHHTLFPLFDALFLETNPAPIKEALYLLGKIPSPHLRLPLVRVRETTRSRLREVLFECGFELVRSR